MVGRIIPIRSVSTRRLGTNAYTGTITYVSEQGKMMIKLTGHKIGGCDNPS